jgi:two-component system LytT family response regulator
VSERLSSALERLHSKEAAAPESRQIFLRDGERCWIVGLDRIHALESEGNYTRVYFEGNRPFIYSSLNALEARLDPTLFFRASRSHMVNLRKIVSMERRRDGRLVAVLNEGLRVNISRRRSRMLRRLLTL